MKESERNRDGNRKIKILMKIFTRQSNDDANDLFTSVCHGHKYDCDGRHSHKLTHKHSCEQTHLHKTTLLFNKHCGWLLFLGISCNFYSATKKRPLSFIYTSDTEIMCLDGIETVCVFVCEQRSCNFNFDRPVSG